MNNCQARVDTNYTLCTNTDDVDENYVPMVVVLSLNHIRLLQFHRLQPARLLCPWDFPGKNTRVGCHFLLQGIVPTRRLNLCLLHCRQILHQRGHQGSHVPIKLCIGQRFFHVRLIIVPHDHHEYFGIENTVNKLNMWRKISYSHLCAIIIVPYIIRHGIREKESKMKREYLPEQLRKWHFYLVKWGKMRGGCSKKNPEFSVGHLNFLIILNGYVYFSGALKSLQPWN